MHSLSFIYLFILTFSSAPCLLRLVVRNQTGQAQRQKRRLGGRSQILQLPPQTRRVRSSVTGSKVSPPLCISIGSDWVTVNHRWLEKIAVCFSSIHRRNCPVVAFLRFSSPDIGSVFPLSVPIGECQNSHMTHRDASMNRYAAFFSF